MVSKSVFLPSDTVAAQTQKAKNKTFFICVSEKACSMAGSREIKEILLLLGLTRKGTRKVFIGKSRRRTLRNESAETLLLAD